MNGVSLKDAPLGQHMIDLMELEGFGSCSSSASSTISVPTQPLQPHSLEKPEVTISATNIHALGNGVAPWPQKPTHKPDGTMRRIFETSAFYGTPMEDEDVPKRRSLSAVISTPNAFQSTADQGTPNAFQSNVFQSSNNDNQQTAPQNVAEERPKDFALCQCSKLNAPKKGILKRTRKYIVTSTTEVVQRSNRVDDADRITLQENVTVVFTGSNRKLSDANKGGERKVRVKFRESHEVVPTYSPQEYDRNCIDYAAKQLTPSLAVLIKLELNKMKEGMLVHADARQNTQFYVVPKMASSTA